MQRLLGGELFGEIADSIVDLGCEVRLFGVVDGVGLDGDGWRRGVDAATLDYTITSTQTATDAPTTIVLDSNTDNRTIVIKMGDGTPLQPENHDRVPIAIVDTNDLQVRGQLASNSGWTFEVLAERSTSDGPLPTPDELQEILYSRDP